MPKRSNLYGLKDHLYNLIQRENIPNQEMMKITKQSSSQVSKWLSHSDKSFPNMEELLIICQRLGISLDDLYEMDKAKLYDELKLEKYAVWDPGTIDSGSEYVLGDPCYYMSEAVLKDKECNTDEGFLKKYVDLLDTFINGMKDYLNGITKNIPIIEANKLLVYYVGCDIETIDGMDEYDFEEFKMFIYNKDYLDFKDAIPHFYPINCDYVMLLNMKNNKELTLRYLKALKKLDDFFVYSDHLKNKYVNRFFRLYAYLMEQTDERSIVDSNGKLFKQIIDYGGRLGDENKYVKIIYKLLPKR